MFALPAGWLADKWSREGMMAVFFVGIGLASIATAFAQTPLQVGIGLFVVGMFAAIYHPVGLAIVTQRWKNTGMRLAVNGVWGNLGVASAALITGYFIDHGGWRSAFVIPGLVSIVIGILYALHEWRAIRQSQRVGCRRDGCRRADVGRLQGAAVAHLDHRVPDHRDLEPDLPVHHIRAAEDVRRAHCRASPRT